MPCLGTPQLFDLIDGTLVPGTKGFHSDEDKGDALLLARFKGFCQFPTVSCGEGVTGGGGG